MAENLEFKIQPNSEDEELQKTFRSLYALNTIRFSHNKEVTEPYRHYRGQIRFGHSIKFLKENKNWLR
jgi:hypothetical protein